MRVADLGEFGLIELVQQWTAPAGPGNAAYRIVAGNGDDAAAVSLSPLPAGEPGVGDPGAGDPGVAMAGVTELYTTDTMVAGVHFTAATTPWRDLGWKALASNISDIAAMGGRPGVALVTLGLPPDTPVDGIAELYAGMNDICRRFGVAIVGGDMVRSPVAFVTVALTGIADGALLLRTAAAAGHQVAVAGPVGGSAGGLRLLLDGGVDDGGEAAAELIRRHRMPCPQVAAGRILAGVGVPAAMDVSDGLADDLGKLCRASGVAATIYADRAPVLPALRARFPEEWPDLALYGGEDYVLLFTAPPGTMAAALAQLPAGAAVIGEITAGEPGQVTVINEDGAVRPRGGGGWDHFAGAGSSAADLPTADLSAAPPSASHPHRVS